MKIIIHQSASSQKDAQSSAWFNHLHLYLRKLNNVKSYMGMKGVTTEGRLENLTPKEAQEHHLVFLTDQDNALLESLQKMKFSPQVIFSGLSVPLTFLDDNAVLPNIMIFPKWVVTKEQELKLSDKTFLIKTSVINNEYAEFSEPEDFNAYFEANFLQTSETFADNVLAIQLERNIKNSCYHSKKHRDDFIKSISNTILTHRLSHTPLKIVIAPPIYTNDINLCEDNAYTQIFIASLECALRRNNIFNFSLLELKESADKVSAAEALTYVVENASTASIFIPANEQGLLARSQLLSILDANVYAYGLKQDPVADALNAGNYLRQVLYQYNESDLHPVPDDIEELAGDIVCDGLELMVQQIMSQAKLRGALHLKNLKNSPTFFSVSTNPAFSENNATQTPTKSIILNPSDKPKKIKKSISFHKEVEDFELEKSKKEMNEIKPQTDNGLSFWALCEKTMAAGVVVAGMAMAYNMSRK